jgi:hypothetical protein
MRFGYKQITDKAFLAALTVVVLLEKFLRVVGPMQPWMLFETTLMSVRVGKRTIRGGCPACACRQPGSIEWFAVCCQ